MKQSVPETSKLRFGHPARNEAESRFHVFVCFVPFGRGGSAVEVRDGVAVEVVRGGSVVEGVSAVEDEPVLGKKRVNLISQSWRFSSFRLERSTALKSFAIKADLPMLDQSRSGLGFLGFFLSNSILPRGPDASSVILLVVGGMVSSKLNGFGEGSILRPLCERDL